MLACAGLTTESTAAEQSDASSTNATAGALPVLEFDANSTAGAANAMAAGTAFDTTNSTLPVNANETLSAPTNNTDSISNASSINLNLTASDWHRGRHTPWDGGSGGGSSSSGWQGDWQGNWQVDQSEDRWSDALPACPPGQGRPSPSEQCQLCPYGRFSPGGMQLTVDGSGAISCGTAVSSNCTWGALCAFTNAASPATVHV